MYLVSSNFSNTNCMDANVCLLSIVYWIYNSITSTISSEPSHFPHPTSQFFYFPIFHPSLLFSHISTLVKWTCHTNCHTYGNRSSRKRKKYYDSMNDCSLYLIAWVEFIQMTCFNPHTFLPSNQVLLIFFSFHDSSFSL